MRLDKYLLYTKLDEKTNEFRSLNIKMSSDPVNYSCIFEHLKEKHNIDASHVEKLIEEINKKLRKVYKGKFLFALCINEGMAIEDIKIDKRYIKTLKLLQFDANDKLAKIKKEVERKLLS